MRLGRANAMRAGFPLLKKRAGINLRAWCTVLPQHGHAMGGCVFLCGDCVHHADTEPQLVSIPIRAGLLVLPKNAKYMAIPLNPMKKRVLGSFLREFKAAIEPPLNISPIIFA